MKTYQQLEQENERLKNQELQGVRVTLNEMLTDDQQKTWGLENAGHKRNVQHIFMRTCLAIGELEKESERLKKELKDANGSIWEAMKHMGGNRRTSKMRTKQEAKREALEYLGELWETETCDETCGNTFSVRKKLDTILVCHNGSIVREIEFTHLTKDAEY